MIRVILPAHLRSLARIQEEVALEVPPPVTQRAILEALESHYPQLRGTLRAYGTYERRPFLRFFACKQDLSLEPPDSLVPEAVAAGEEPFRIVGAMAGG